jgi:hypothetical protein
VIEALKQSCIHDKPAVLSRRDAWTGAGVLIGGSLKTKEDDQRQLVPRTRRPRRT